ncbi:MAG: ATP-binding protein [Flavobacteriales bacterium]|mgnify:CR=1 FL=1|nr:ATP-binding protein [Flavobacteriales bacterium]MBK9194784.1 ATP-binding protein [Flavobacteriales bacterium]
MKKIVVTGPESSGKTTLTLALGDSLRAVVVNEVAREYIDELDRPYAESDLLVIAKAQLELEDALSSAAGPDGRIICDTELLTIRIWSEEKYGRCEPWIVEQTERRHYDHWLLCKPDIPWEPDPQRENPLDRDRLFAKYEARLRGLGKPFTVIHGDHAQRVRMALEACTKLL